MFLFFLLGAILASYMYQLVSTSNINFKMFYSRSKCECCHNNILVKDLVPIVSYLYLRGKCRFCKSTIPFELFLCELLLGLLFLIPLSCDASFDTLLFYYLLIFLVPLSIYDACHFIIPNHILVVMVITTFMLFDISIRHISVSIFIILLLNCLYFVSNGGIGYGDIKLFGLLSFLLSASQFLLTFMFTFIIAGIFTLIYMCVSKKQFKKVPLVPFITIATLLVLILNHQLNYYFLGGSYGH